MKLELERIKVSPSAYSTYVDVGSVNPNGKRIVFRTKSEPIHSRARVNYGKRMLGHNTLPEYKEVKMPGSSRENQDNFTSKDVYIVLQTPTEYCQVKGLDADSKAVISDRHSKAKLLNSCSHKSAHKRSSSISEGDLIKRHCVVAAEDLQPHVTEQDFTGCDNAMSAVSSISLQPIPTETGLSRTVITKQPQPVTNEEPSSDIQTRDNCFRCLKMLQNFVNCCTCIWCFDACCYHCFKDDVGYTSWFKEMVSCNKRPMESIQQWSLFGLATVAFPCILFYPILGGAVNQCLKCRLAKHHNH